MKRSQVAVKAHAVEKKSALSLELLAISIAVALMIGGLTSLSFSEESAPNSWVLSE